MAEEEQSKKKSNYFDRWLEKQAAEKKNDTVADEQSEKDEKITDEQPKKAEEEKKSDEKIEDVIVDGDFEVVQEEYEVSGHDDGDEEKSDKDASNDEEKKSEDVEKTEENSEESTSEDEKKEKPEDQPEEEEEEREEEKSEESSEEENADGESKEEPEEKIEEKSEEEPKEESKEESEEEPKEDSHKDEDKKEETESDKKEPKKESDNEKPEEKQGSEEKATQPAPTGTTGSSVIAKPGEYAAMEPTKAITSANEEGDLASTKVKVPKKALMSKRELERRDTIIKVCLVVGTLVLVGAIVAIILWTLNHEERYSCELTTGSNDSSYTYKTELQFKGNKLTVYTLVGNMYRKNGYTTQDESDFREDFRKQFRIVGDILGKKDVTGEIVSSRELKLSYTEDFVAESNEKGNKNRVKEVSKNEALDSLRASNFQCTEK